ncbi:hypothetical protein [Paraburkholderia gardini]|uniref:Uncharacterized protein n=1 Tax=Paraburkholderia gardini TaxID=2823469 RepID=A0ABN7QN54_9BURK|nr:hypothetical protein [Paraburkholderia gardini]CAG4911437.1 hypothetical protein R54767_03792 [Paraburkholderia gardini]
MMKMGIAVQRQLTLHERRLLEFLLSINEPLYGALATEWKTQTSTLVVCDVDPSCFFAKRVAHVFEADEFDIITLRRELIGIDEGVPVLIYALVEKSPGGYVLDSFSVDRLDGKALRSFPDAGENLMVMEGGRRIDGADWRNVYSESEYSPPRKLV